MGERMSEEEYLRREGMNPVEGTGEVEFPEDTLKRIEYQRAEGITPEVEAARQAGQLPSPEATLQAIEHEVEKRALRERLQLPDGRELTDVIMEALHQFMETYKTVATRIHILPESTQRDSNIAVISDVSQEISLLQRGYQLGDVSSEVLLQRIQEDQERLEAVAHQLDT